MSDEEFRLRQWIRDYGKEKTPQFISSLESVLDDLVTIRRERDRLRTVLEAWKRADQHRRRDCEVCEQDCCDTGRVLWGQADCLRRELLKG